MLRILLLIIITTFVTKSYAQRPWVCVNYPILHDDYYESEKYYHHYTFSNIICPVNNAKGLTVDDIFNILISNVSFTAPTSEQSKVVNCGKVTLYTTQAYPNIIFRYLDKATALINWLHGTASAPIVTYINPTERSVVNYTLEDHPLHDGKVTRTVLIEDNYIRVVTVGVGNSKSLWGYETNSCDKCMKELWAGVDNRLRTAVNNVIEYNSDDNGQAHYKSPKELFKFEQISIPGNLAGVVDTKILIEQDDYVYIQVDGKITVGENLGKLVGEIDATGTINPMLRLYNKYSGRHGALFYHIGNEQGACVNMFAGENELKKIIYSVTALGPAGLSPFSKISGTYFLASSAGNLTLDINDRNPEDNTGQFLVSILVIKRDAHLRRNIFNKCPIKVSLVRNSSWQEESIKSIYYHGLGNTSYRGKTQANKGCQCVYGDSNGLPLSFSDPDKGSFDIGNWIGNKPEPTPFTENYYHLIFDMIPHDLYKEKFGPIIYLDK